MSSEKAKPSISYAVTSGPAGQAVHRNKVTIKTPAGKDLVLPTVPLAEAVCLEWQAQSDKIKPDTMPMTQLAMTAIDITAKDRSLIVEQIAGYARTDLLCHFATHPVELVRRQRAAWQPLLDWCAKRYAAPLIDGEGLMPIPQPPESLIALRLAVDGYDDYRLTGLQQAVDVSGSLVLGLALSEGHLTAEQIFAAAEIDAFYQAETWGEDSDIVKKQASILRDLKNCEGWFALLC
jgi:chaperone required for assembly of F1-ATPase